MPAFIPTAGYSFGLLSDIKKQVGTDGVMVFLTGLISTADGNGGNYYWDAASTATADDFYIIQVTGVATGRWMRSKNANYAAGSWSTSGIALQSSYVVTHNLGVTPTKVFIQPTSVNASVLNYVSARTATTFTVTFISVPVVGTNNISFDWLAIK